MKIAGKYKVRGAYVHMENGISMGLCPYSKFWTKSPFKTHLVL